MRIQREVSLWAVKKGEQIDQVICSGRFAPKNIADYDAAGIAADAGDP